MMIQPPDAPILPTPSAWGRLLCWLGVHHKMFAYKPRPSPLAEMRIVEVVCFRCGEIFSRDMIMIDNDGNEQ
jgi:hypothetical protein